MRAEGTGRVGRGAVLGDCDAFGNRGAERRWEKEVEWVS